MLQTQGLAIFGSPQHGFREEGELFGTVVVGLSNMFLFVYPENWGDGNDPIRTCADF